MGNLPAVENVILNAGNNFCIGRNVVSRKIGEGAFAHVFEVSFDEFSRFKGALKLPKSESAVVDIESRKMILSALGRSPYSANLVDCGVYEGLPYVVEVFREKSLADVIRENVSAKIVPSVSDFVDLGKKLLAGIDYFHRLGETDKVASEKLGLKCLVHGDIKPSNILQAVDSRGVGWEYTDFGIRILKDKKDAGGVVGTLSSISLDSIVSDSDKKNLNLYVAPEVRKSLLFKQTPQATVQSDLWSVGAVLFAYLTGRAPEWGESNPHDAVFEVSSGFKDFFGKILDGNPSKRFKDASGALDGLLQASRQISAKSADSYVIGVFKDSFAGYQVFKQPMCEGLPAGSPKWINLNGGFSLQNVFYLNDLNKMVISYLSKGLFTNTSVGFLVVDDNFKLDKQHIFSDGPGIGYELIFRKEKTEVFRHPSNGRVVVCSKVWHNLFTEKFCYSLPLLNNLGKDGFDNAVGFFSDWVKIGSAQRYFEKKGSKESFELVLDGGSLAVKKQPSREYVSVLPFKNVVSASWIPA